MAEEKTRGLTITEPGPIVDPVPWTGRQVVKNMVKAREYNTPKSSLTPVPKGAHRYYFKETGSVTVNPEMAVFACIARTLASASKKFQRWKEDLS